MMAICTGKSISLEFFSTVVAIHGPDKSECGVRLIALEKYYYMDFISTAH